MRRRSWWCRADAGDASDPVGQTHYPEEMAEQHASRAGQVMSRLQQIGNIDVRKTSKMTFDDAKRYRQS